MGHQIKTSVRILASPERVYAILTDLERYVEWNPFIRPATGQPRAGEPLQLTIGGTRFRPRVLVAEPGREFRWLGKLGFGGLFDGEHYFLLRPDGPGATVVEQGERFSGLLVPLLRRKLDTDTVAGFRAMNEALRKRAEG